MRYFMARHLFTDLVTYCATIGVYLAFENFSRFRRTAIAAAQSDARAARAAAEPVRGEDADAADGAHPHFLFNALNAVAGLVRRREHDAAIETLSQLGDLLRTTLNREMPAEVPLVEELQLLDRFLNIERVRFGDRLHIVRDIENEAQSALVPPLILQPIVENALKHGIARRTGPGVVYGPFRTGGDEFAILLAETPAADACVAVERLLLELEDVKCGRVRGVSVSVGVADLTVAVTPEGLLAAAREGLEAACAAGGGRVAECPVVLLRRAPPTARPEPGSGRGAPTPRSCCAVAGTTDYVRFPCWPRVSVPPTAAGRGADSRGAI